MKKTKAMNFNPSKETQIIIGNKVIHVNISNHFWDRFQSRYGYHDLNEIIKGSWSYFPKKDTLPNNISSEIYHKTRNSLNRFFLINDLIRALIVIAPNDKYWYHNAHNLILVTIIPLANNTFNEDDLDIEYSRNGSIVSLSDYKVKKSEEKIKVRVGNSYIYIAA
jgi:hypothetical protein